ncbi:hypothetical protein NL676_007429 [Syzygium grande]|nr:hypothetical protein NL676_007429 [Syzygium grande]
MSQFWRWWQTTPPAPSLSLSLSARPLGRGGVLHQPGGRGRPPPVVGLGLDTSFLPSRACPSVVRLKTIQSSPMERDLYNAVCPSWVVSKNRCSLKFGGNISSCQSPSADSVGVKADYLTYSCQNEYGNYSINSTFESNLKLLLDSLPYNTATTGFNNTTVGEGLNRVYGQALCRGDASSIACESCVSNASQEIMKLCNAEDALIWYELCQVHHSFQDFFSNMVYTGKYPDSNSQEKLASDPAHFYT